MRIFFDFLLHYSLLSASSKFIGAENGGNGNLMIGFYVLFFSRTLYFTSSTIIMTIIILCPVTNCR